MRRRACTPAFAAVFLSVLTFCARARADDHGFVLGARTGYGIPYGTSFGSGPRGPQSLPGSYNGMVPFIFEAEYRVGKIAFGPFFQYAFALPTPAACKATAASCSGTDVRLGVSADYHFFRRPAWDPWVAVGIAYEWTSVHGSGASTIDDSLRGLELFEVSAGFDFDVARALRVGPFLTSTFAQYTSDDFTQDTMHFAGPIANDLGEPAPHGWLILGVRIRWEP